MAPEATAPQDDDADFVFDGPDALARVVAALVVGAVTLPAGLLGVPAPWWACAEGPPAAPPAP